MHIKNIARFLGLLMVTFSVTMLPPIGIALWFRENTLQIFTTSTLITLIAGFLLWFPFRNIHKEFRVREGFLIVTLLWIVLCGVSSLPFILANTPDIRLIDALFESVSGLTTTGATVLVGLDTLPKSLLYYRQQLQFIGGGGIILLAIAILPLLGVGGMQLYRAEMTGPFKEEKLTPRIAHTGKALWMIYVGLVVACAFCFWLGGMTLFDAVVHSFSTVSTGGFSTHDASFVYFNSQKLQLIAVIFMVLGASNFSLHFIAFTRGGLKHYWQDSEFKSYCLLLILVSILIFVPLLIYGFFANPQTALVASLFQATTFLTTTGFSSAYYANWPTYVPILLMLICLIGGCAGSTGGGIKMIRILVLSKQSVREIDRLIHPNGHYIIKLGNSPLGPRTLDALWGFFGVFVAIFAILLLLLMATGLDFLTAFSSLTATISGTGIGLGLVTDHFKLVNDGAKGILTFAMLAGRLEFFTLLVLMVPGYWRN